MNELVLCCERGLYFGQLAGYKFSLNKRAYLEGQLISQAVEYTPQGFLVTDFNKPGYYMIDRREENVKKSKRREPTFIEDQKFIYGACTDLNPMPGFDMNTFPYLLTRTSFSINLFDLKRKQTHTLILDKKPGFDNQFMSVFSNVDGKVSIVYCAMTKDENFDAIKIFSLPMKFLEGLRHFSNNDG